jgi:putative exosortase-associated protein (TIGR04073 family)
MKRILALALLLAATSFTVRADISMPIRDTFYDKLGRGLADVVTSPSELLDSQYGMIDTEGDTVAFCKGFVVQGMSRMAMDIGQGVFEIVTSPFPTQNFHSYRSQKLPPYDSMVVNEYPPGDLKNWY